MSDKLFELEILTPSRNVFKGTVSSLVVPAAYGYLGVWAGHAPLIASLRPGRLILRDAAGASKVIESQGSGVLEVYKNKATVLADTIG